MRYVALNPSIQKSQNGYDLICRTVNYIQSGGMNYRTIDSTDPIVKTKNFLMRYDSNFNLLSQQEIVENVARTRLPNIIQGLEDCRLIALDGNRWFTATCCDTPSLVPTQTLCKLEANASGNAIQVEKFTVLKGPNPTRCEKNWLPFIQNGEIHAIYSCDPWIIYKIDPETGACKTMVDEKPPADLSRFRGSAPPIAFDNGHLFLIHEVIFGDRRYYVHRFVYVDKDYQPKMISKPFTFMQQGIEYCCGMVIDHAGTSCILSIGIEDREAYLCFVGLETIRSMLEPLPKLQKR